MSKTLNPESVVDVAENLHVDFGMLVQEQWEACAEARIRSSVSRAYYGAFLYLKAKLLPTRTWAPQGFPQVSVHGRLMVALRDSLGRQNRIYLKFKALLDHRAAADYELDGDYPPEFAEDRCDDADDLIRWIDELSERKLAEIANRVA